MKETITSRFNTFSKSDIGAIITLNKAVRGMRYGQQVVIDAFNKLVPKGEYLRSEKDDILLDTLRHNNS
jgi:hypothetical protein